MQNVTEHSTTSSTECYAKCTDICIAQKLWVQLVAAYTPVRMPQTGLAKNVLGRTCMYTEVARTDEALSPSFLTCTSPHRCSHWRGQSMWQV